MRIDMLEGNWDTNVEIGDVKNIGVKHKGQRVLESSKQKRKMKKDKKKKKKFLTMLLISKSQFNSRHHLSRKALILTHG